MACKLLFDGRLSASVFVIGLPSGLVTIARVTSICFSGRLVGVVGSDEIKSTGLKLSSSSTWLAV